MTTQTRETSGPEDFDWFTDNGIYMPMINDTGRNVFYKAAIESSVSGKVVCDIGCGSGLLSILAAKAGATKVYAVEMDPGRAAFAEAIIAKLGLTNIEIIKGDFLAMDIKADIYVSETIGAQIYNENIINIAEHARRHGGVFIPSQFDMWVEVYEHHPIFILTSERSEAFEFQPDIEIDPVFENNINSVFRNKHSLDDTLYKANTTNDLFQLLPRFTDLKLNKLYTTPTLTIDLNQQVDPVDLKFAIPNSSMPIDPHSQEIALVLFWKARYQTHVMASVDCWWPHVSKIILPRTRSPGIDTELYYVPEIDNWRLRF